MKPAPRAMGLELKGWQHGKDKISWALRRTILPMCAEQTRGWVDGGIEAPSEESLCNNPGSFS